MPKRRWIARTAAALFFFAAGGGFAQDTAATPPVPVPSDTPPAPPAADGPKQQAGEEIVVTGSRVRRKDLTTPAPVTVLTREQFEQSGKATIGDFLQSLPEQGNAPNFQLNNGGSTYSANGSTNVNLRSLGVGRTLVLVNGRRVVPAGLGASSAVDLNTIPTEAVERIEILKDGASAIYGSDAIGGVVNIITRRNLNATETGVQYGISEHGDAQTFEAHVTTGRKNDSGSFMFSAGFYNQGDSFLRSRDWSANALTYDYNLKQAQPGGSGRTPQGIVSLPSNGDGSAKAGCATNVVCNYITTQLDPLHWQQDNFVHDPAAPHGWRLATGSDLYNFASVNYLTTPSTRLSFFSAGDTHYGNVRGFYEASYVQRNSTQNAAPMPLNPADYGLTMSAASLYNPFGVDLESAGRRLVEFGNRTYSQELATFRVVTGVEGNLSQDFGPLNGWFWEASMNYGRTSGTFTTGGSIRNSRVADVLGPSMIDPATGKPTCVTTAGDISTAIPGCTPLNMFGGPNNGSIDPAQIGYLGFTGVSRAFDALYAIDLNATGDLFKIAGDRAVSLAFGYEFRRQSGAQIADPIAASGDSADFNFQSTQGHFTANEAYAELDVPVLANLPGVEDLEASAAMRFVDYSTFGTNFTFKAGLRYSPTRDFALRGTYSTAFRAPSISELYLGQSETAPPATDPCNFDPATADPALVRQCVATGVHASGSGDRGQQELVRQGGNTNLQPETAKIFTLGAVFTPTQLKDLSITVDYYHTTVDNLIGPVGSSAILSGCYTGSSGPQNQAECSLITRDPNSGRILFISDTNQNLGTLTTAGIDLAIRYSYGTPVGRFGAVLDGTWLQTYDRTQALGPVIHGVGTFDLGALPALKANLGFNWTSAFGLTVGGLVHYIGTFKECGAFDSSSGDFLSAGGLCYAGTNLPSRQVGHNTTLDLHASYALQTPVGRTLIVAGMNNVFDQSPQSVYSAPLANSDPGIYDFVGRYVYGRVQQTF